MRYTDVAAHSDTGARWLAILLGASIPISTFLDSVLLPLIFLLWLISLPGGFSHVARRLRENPVALSALGLFLVLAAGTMYGPAPPSQAFGTLVKYVDLMVLPVFAALFAARLDRERGLMCFTVAIILSLAVSYVVQAGLLIEAPLLPRHPKHPSGFKFSITHSVVIALGALLFGLLARESARAGERVGYAALALLCAHNVLFVVISRTGYLVLAALTVYFVVTNVRGRKGVLVAALAAAIVATAAYTSSASFRDRVVEAVAEFSDWQPGSMAGTSVGLRLEWYRTSLEIIADRPLIGVGTGGFQPAYAAKRGRSAGPVPDNPHNDYLMLTVQVGVTGLVLLLTLYVALWRIAKRLPNRLERDLARGLVLTMAIGGAFNSFLLDHTEGLLFSWLAALLTGGLQSSGKEQTVNG